jgi:hypothetical protein
LGPVVVEAVAWLPFAVGALLTLFTVGAAIHLLTGHAFGRGRSLAWRLQATLLLAALALIPIATAGYRSPAWHAMAGVRVAEVLFGGALVAIPFYAFVASRQDGGGPALVSSERLPGQGSLLQVALAAVLIVGAGVAFVRHGLDLFDPIALR